MNKKYTNTFPIIVLLLGIAASIMVFLPALKYKDSDATYTGLKIITGVNIFNLGSIADGKLPFSILALLAFVLPVVAGIIFFTSPKNAIISIVLFAGAAVLLFLLPEYTKVVVNTFIGGETELDIKWVLQVGTIIAGSLSCAGGALVLLGLSQK